MPTQMSMLAVGFIAPLFALAGLFAVAIPIIIHLLNRRRYKVQSWAAMHFLLAAMKKNRRKLRFEQWLLLAMRCAVVLLAGLALARPMGCDQSTLARLAGQSSALHVIIIDDSYSMNYRADRPGATTHLDQAKKIAHQAIDRMTSGNDAVILITASESAGAIIPKASYDLPAVTGAIDRIQPKYTGTDLPGALEIALQSSEETKEFTTHYLHIFSDSTVSAWKNGHEKQLETLGVKLKEKFRIEQYNFSLPSQSNAAIQDVFPNSNLVRTRFTNDFRAIARAFGASVNSIVQWQLGDEPLPGGMAINIDSQTPPITQSNIQLRTGGATVVSARITADDRLPIDNIRYRTIDVANEMKVLIVEGRRGSNPLDGSGAYLDLALAPPTIESQPGRPTDSYIKPERISDIELNTRVLSEYRAIMLTDISQVSPATADQIAGYVKDGGTIVWFMGDQVARENYNSVLLPRGLIPGPLTQRMTGQGYNFDFNPSANNHPLLQAFGNVDKSGLDTAAIYTYWQIQPKDDLHVEHVLDFKSTGQRDPAITMQSLGDGHIVFIATSADAEWTSFPAKPAYVALIHELVAGAVAGSDEWMNLQVGQSLELPPTFKTEAAPTIAEAGASQAIPLEYVSRDDNQWVYRSQPISKPGVYKLNIGSSTLPISVNLPADEADVRTLTDSAIKQALGNIEMEFHSAELPEQAVAVEDGRDFGWMLMFVVLLLLGSECYLAMRFGHYKRS